jgi:UDP-glucuronate decarboxylase
MKKIRLSIVCGGAGFIGSHLCDKLIKQGKHVACVDNLSSGDINNIAHLLNHPQFKFVQADIAQPDWLRKLHVSYGKRRLIRLDVQEVWFLASLASPSDYLQRPLETINANVLGISNVLDITSTFRSAKFLYTSTSEVYGDPEVMPQSEEYTGNVDPICDRAVYDETKRCGETITMAYHREKGVDVKIVRIFNTYGPRMRANDGRVVPNFIMQVLRGMPITIYGDGKQTRSFCYIDDMVNGLLSMMDSKESGPINLGNPICYLSVLDLARMVQFIAKKEVDINYLPFPSQNDPKIRQPDIAKAAQLLKWKPTTYIVAGLIKTIDYFRSTI